MSRNRLQKKCFIVSLGMHLLLLLVVVFGVAFATTRKKEAGERGSKIYVHLLVSRASPTKGKSSIAAAGGAASGTSHSGAATGSPGGAAACAPKAGDPAKDNSTSQGQTETKKNHAKEDAHSQESGQEDRTQKQAKAQECAPKNSQD